jgi:hypothetical protein
MTARRPDAKNDLVARAGAEMRILAREDFAGPLIDRRRCRVEERVLTSFMGDF